mgnify:CR=1 FL=1
MNALFSSALQATGGLLLSDSWQVWVSAGPRQKIICPNFLRLGLIPFLGRSSLSSRQASRRWKRFALEKCSFRNLSRRCCATRRWTNLDATSPCSHLLSFPGWEYWPHGRHTGESSVNLFHQDFWVGFCLDIFLNTKPIRLADHPYPRQYYLQKLVFLP